MASTGTAMASRPSASGASAAAEAAASSKQGSLDPPGKVRFLLEMSARFEAEGNVSEAVKSAETALLLRRSLPVEAQSLFASTLSQQAADLVVKCNALGVQQFQRDQYPLAEFILAKALFLTEDAKATNCFGHMEHERLRLRAATFNNLGCLEKRRGQLEAGLTHLHKAAEIEALVDPDVGASPSTQLNLCTLLNKMGRHDQAAAAAERAIRNIGFLEQSGTAPNPSMVLMAHYNCGVSLEFMGRPGDISRARDCYAQCLAHGQRYGIAIETSTALQQAQRALARIDAAMPAAAKARGGMAGSAVHVARGSRSASASVASSEQYTPRPPGHLRQPPPQARGIMTAPSGAARDSINKHKERIQAKQKRREQQEKRSRDALRRAQLAHDREKNEKLRIEQEEAARQRDALAREMYEQMESGIRADRIRTLYQAATSVQKVWRGFLVRAHLRDMAIAVVKMQAVVRSHLCRLSLKRAEDQAREEQEYRKVLQTRHEAAVVIQRKARQFLRRCTLVRNHRASTLRRKHSVAKIVRFYHAYRRRVADRILDKLEAERKAQAQRNEMLNEAARKIQTMFRSFRSRRFMRVVRQEQLRRNAAATKIQAAMRGSLTRAWFKHYRLYRRQQELSTAANLKSIVKIQCSWRVAIAKKRRRELALAKRRREHLERVFKSARCIQCAWRSFIARGVAFDLRRIRQRRDDAATTIQLRWRAFQCRKEYLWKRDEARKMRALRRIQQWWRDVIIARRHVETAKYHARMLRREKELRARTYLALTVTTMMRHVVSARVCEQKRAAFVVRDAAARVVQRVGRGGHDRKDLSVMKRVALLAAQSEAARKRANDAACVIQRNVRLFQAREELNRRRRMRWASVRVQACWRMYVAKQLLKRLRKADRDKREDAAARRIQRSVRLFFKRQELKRLDAYYTARRRHKLLEQRRIEAATTIQAHWRGHATRRATAQARQELLQKTVQAIRIQRSFRTHLYRRSINEEVQRRQRGRSRRWAAAIAIQSFWRRVLATEYVALVRERKFNHTVAALCIQCAWRRVAARRELVRRRAIRSQLQRLTAQRQDAWNVSCLAVQTVLRYQRDAWRVLNLHEDVLTREVERQQRIRHIQRCNAATKIQSRYRGYSERVYARGLRAEAREKEQARLALLARQNRAALRIQCAFRSSVARRRAAELQTAQRLKRLEDEAVAEETADPSNVVKGLFWAHEAHIKRDLTREREERHVVRTRAAITLQRMIRGLVARSRFRRRIREKMEHSAAARIQGEYKKHRAAAEAAAAGKRAAAATRIQSIVRMFLVLQQWPARRHALDTRKSATVRDEERRDVAATKVQSVFRGHRARTHSRELHKVRREAKWRQVQFEAARAIQKHVRRLLAVNRVTKLRYERMRSAAATSDVAPAAQQSQQASSDVGPSPPQAAPAPAPPPASAPQPEAAESAPPAPPPRRSSNGLQPAPPKVPRPPSGGPSRQRPSRPGSASAPSAPQQ
uniref:Uncharacterized protein n=1 Tax=Neobodo designis TaxID=312471 RepID=A0A7S1LPI7_NEODS|mmetsp:Transcript_25791/g.79549  ORF Transcript_25791/g.79549 Transcript_25791/m.79549 type:complete len:1482 (+) Transcript_25791:136-4581(+)